MGRCLYLAHLGKLIRAVGIRGIAAKSGISMDCRKERKKTISHLGVKNSKGPKEKVFRALGC